MSRSGSDASFEVPVLPALRHAGLSGMMAKVRLEGDVLRIVGEEGGELAIPAREVERLRLAKFAGSRVGTLHEARIWRERAAEPLLILPADPSAYAHVMRGFAGRVAAVRGLGRVMRGPGLSTAIVNLLLINGSLSFLAAGLVLLAMFQETWPWWLLAALVVAADLLALRDALINRWPRAVRSLDELDRELPPKG